MVVDLNDRNSTEEKRQSAQANLAFWLNFFQLLFFYWRIFVLHTLLCLILQYTKHVLGKLCSTTWLLPPVLQASAQCYFINAAAAAAAAKPLPSCPTLRDPTDGSPPASAVPGILQARTLEWVAISFSNAWKWKVKVKSLSRVRLFATPWTVAYQAPPSIGFSRQEYWSGVPLPSPTLSMRPSQTTHEMVPTLSNLHTLPHLHLSPSDELIFLLIAHLLQECKLHEDSFFGSWLYFQHLCMLHVRSLLIHVQMTGWMVQEL